MVTDSNVKSENIARKLFKLSPASDASIILKGNSVSVHRYKEASIERAELIPWPLESPQLSALTFCLCGYMKDIVQNHLRNRPWRPIGF
jgi:hypothetical protein